MRTARKPSSKLKRKPAPRRPAAHVDPTRLAVAAVERIKTVLTRTGKLASLGAPATMRDLAARASYLGVALPSSYSAALRIGGALGGPERFLTSDEMKAAFNDEVGARMSRPDTERYAPFCKLGDRRYVCFDRQATTNDGELPVVEWNAGITKLRAQNFAEWLDEVADAREDAVAEAADLPRSLRTLLINLGFTFEDPIVGRLETGDTEAIEELLGRDQTREVRGNVERLFDSSGKASLTLNVDEFSLAVSLRTGIFLFEAGDVFRWLRSFRDENFYGESQKAPSHSDRTRDLRRAPREAPLILRGMLELTPLPARRHVFRAAGGRSAEDFYLLGRTASTSDRSPSLLLHVVAGKVAGAHSLDEPLLDLYVTPDGTIWALSHAGTAIRFVGNSARAFPLQRATRGRPWWYGIGGSGANVLVWGAGALLALDDDRFVPFAPSAGLEDHESVVALSANGAKVAMLVCGDHVGAVARFDGKKWLPIDEDKVIEGDLCDLDVWRGVGIVLARTGEVWRVEEEGPPRAVLWDTEHQAFVAEGGTPRPTHAVRGIDGGALVATDGGVISVGAGDPVFHAATGCNEPARLSRVGDLPTSGSRSKDDLDGTRSGIVAMCGPNAWIWRKDAFYVIDLREW
jgi:hypothetical protein